MLWQEAARTLLAHIRLVLPAPLLLLCTLAVDVHAAAPTISGTPPATATVGTRYLFIPQAADRDGDQLRFWIYNRPVWAGFNYRTGQLSGTPGKWAIGTSATIYIGVTDGSRRGRVSLPPFTITVRPAGTQTPTPNLPPVISGAPPSEILQGQAYSFTPTASDPDGDALTFSISNKPAWASFSRSTGRLYGTPSAAAVGNYSNVVISVSDGTQSRSLAPFSIAVVSYGTGSATLSWEPPVSRTDGSPLTNLAGYKVLWGTTQGTYTRNVTLNNPGLTTHVIDDLSPATYYFVVVAFDSDGSHSGYSNEAQIRVP